MYDGIWFVPCSLACTALVIARDSFELLPRIKASSDLHNNAGLPDQQLGREQGVDGSPSSLR